MPKKKKRSKKHVVKIGNCYRAEGTYGVHWYWVLGPINKIGLYPCESVWIGEGDNWHVQKNTRVHPNNLIKENQVTETEYIRTRIKVGAEIHRFCDPHYRQRMDCLSLAMRQAGIT